MTGGELINRLKTLPRSTRDGWGRRLVVAMPLGWLLLFFLAPFLFVLKIAFSEGAGRHTALYAAP